jgi:hypothetical protein
VPRIAKALPPLQKSAPEPPGEGDGAREELGRGYEHDASEFEGRAEGGEKDLQEGIYVPDEPK